MVRKRPGRHPLRTVLIALSGAAIGLLPLAPIQAATGPEAFPSSELFRQLQLQTLACGRENKATPCEQARNQADQLLDHPRLPALCKDTLWSIRQKAQVAAVNTPERRDPIDRAAQDLPLLCRQKIRPASKPEEARPAAAGGGASNGGSSGGQPGLNFGMPSR